MTAKQDVEALIERLDEEWLQKSRSSFDCQECGIAANLLDVIKATLRSQADALASSQAEVERLRTLLRIWRETADIAKDLTFVPIAKHTDATLKEPV